MAGLGSGSKFLLLPFLNELGNSKLFDLYLIFHHITRYHSHGNQAIYFHHHGSAVVLPADDLAEWHSLDDFGRMREVT